MQQTKFLLKEEKLEIMDLELFQEIVMDTGFMFHLQMRQSFKISMWTMKMEWHILIWTHQFIFFHKFWELKTQVICKGYITRVEVSQTLNGIKISLLKQMLMIWFITTLEMEFISVDNFWLQMKEMVKLTQSTISMTTKITYILTM